MGCSKSSSEKSIAINAYLKKQKKISNKQPNIIPKRTRKEQMKLKVRKKEIKIKAEINEIETQKSIKKKKNYETKSWFFKR